MTKSRSALPWRKEAYRLWFEFLKAGYRDPIITISDESYLDWGDIRTKKFDDWFSANSERLLTVDAEMRELIDEEAWKAHRHSQHRVAISIPLDCSKRDAVEQVRKLLMSKRAGLKARRGKSLASKYFISAKNLKYAHLRQLLRIYRYWIDTNKSLDATAKLYFKWAKETNAKREKWRATRKAKGKKPYWMTVPEAGWELYVKGDADSRRRSMRRYVKKASRIAKNTASGNFPGKY